MDFARGEVTGFVTRGPAIHVTDFVWDGKMQVPTCAVFVT